MKVGLRLISMKDIAEALNVSRTTVSNILNNNKNKSYKKETIERVFSKAKEMGYTTNNIAVSLKTGKTNSIAIVVPDIANDFYINIIKEVEDLAKKSNLNLVICITEESIEKENKYLDMLRSQMIDGILIAPVSYERSLHYDYPFKIVCFDRTTYSNKYPYVAINNFQSAKQLTLKLLNNNYQKPLFLAGSREDITNIYRLEGYKEALREKDIKYNTENIIFDIYDENSALKKLNTYFNNNTKFCDSIFLSSNYSIYGVLKSLKINNLNNLPLGGFESFKGYEFLKNKIYTAKQPDKQIARYAFDKLVRLLNDKQVVNSTLKTNITSNYNLMEN